MRNVLTFPAKEISLATQPVDLDPNGSDFKDIKLWVGSMIHIFESNDHALGLAANQIGIMKDIILFSNAPSGAGRGANILINPVIISHEDETEVALESCLSMPGLSVKIERYKQIEITGFDMQLQPKTFVAEGPEARVIQHEIDHLKGKLIIDHGSNFNRSLLIDKYLKYKKKINRFIKRRSH